MKSCFICEHDGKVFASHDPCDGCTDYSNFRLDDWCEETQQVRNMCEHCEDIFYGKHYDDICRDCNLKIQIKHKEERENKLVATMCVVCGFYFDMKQKDFDKRPINDNASCSPFACPTCNILY